jgi:hypothetical protein
VSASAKIRLPLSCGLHQRGRASRTPTLTRPAGTFVETSMPVVDHYRKASKVEEVSEAVRFLRVFRGDRGAVTGKPRVGCFAAWCGTSALALTVLTAIAPKLFLPLSPTLTLAGRLVALGGRSVHARARGVCASAGRPGWCGCGCECGCERGSGAGAGAGGGVGVERLEW